jgi:hypothetical protein
MYHAERTERNGCGENLAWNTRTDHLLNTNAATQAWYDEIVDPGYNFADPGYYENPGAGHFTQVVWKASTELGCGISGDYVACRYCNGSGNYLNQFEANVFPKGDEA